MAGSQPNISWDSRFGIRCGHELTRLNSLTGFYGSRILMSCVLSLQARDVRTNEVVAIKKMSYSGKQSNEVRELLLYTVGLRPLALACCISHTELR